MDTKHLLSAAAKWSPAGIAIAAICVFLALGGKQGAVEIVEVIAEANGASAKMSAEFAALGRQIEAHMQSTDERLKNEQAQRDKLQAQMHCQEKHITMLCHFASQQNGGRPEPDWCGARGEGLTWQPRPLDSVIGQRFRTDAEWVDCEKLLAD
jgi:hypothetical protein